MPSKTYVFNEELGPLLQQLLLENPEVESASYIIEYTSLVKKTTINLSTKKLDPDSVFEETLIGVIDKIQTLKNTNIQ